MIGYVVGVFDKLHYGHKNLLIEARQLCDRLIIGVHTDDFVKNYKRLPTQNQDIRKKNIITYIKENLNYFHNFMEDDIIIIADNHIKIINEYGIREIYHGTDWEIESYKKQIKYYESGMDKIGVNIKLIDYTKGISTTLLLDSNINNSLKDKKCFLFDLDNTLVIDKIPNKFCYDIIKKLNEYNKDIYVITNNNKYTIDILYKLFKSFNINIKKENIINTLLVISRYLFENKYKNIYVWGGDNAKEYFLENNFIISEDDPEIIIILYNDKFDYSDICRLCELIKKSPYIIGNIDRTYPDKEKILPDTGCIWKYIEYACEKTPINIFGKPNVNMIQNVLDKYSKNDIIFIGDSKITDYNLTKNANIDFIHIHPKYGDISNLGVLCDYF